MSMPNWTLLLAILLLVLGLGFYLGTGMQSVTALIPAFLGLPILACALAARRDTARAVAMHAAAVLAVLGLAGTASGVVKTATLLGGGEVARPNAAVGQALVALLCLAYLALSVRSFVRARRARGAETAAGG